MSAPPYMPLYVDDYEAATAHLTPEEDGLYNRLLRLCWRTPGCTIPADSSWIARRIRVPIDVFDRVVAPLLDEFFTLTNGRWQQKRLLAEFRAIERKSASRKKAGKTGGLAKAAKTKAESASNASDLLRHTRANPEPEPEPDKSTCSYEHAADRGEPPEEAVEGLVVIPLPDLRTRAWREAKRILVQQGRMTEAAAGAFFGKLLKTSGLGAEAERLWPALASTELAATQDPRGYLTAAARGVAERRKSSVQRIDPQQARDNFARGLMEAVDRAERKQAGGAP